jgi:PAS domain S-box-containing protein
MTAHLITDDGTVIASSERQFLSQLRDGKGILPRIDKERYAVVAEALRSQTGDKVWLFKSGKRRFLATLEQVAFSPNGKYKLVLTVPEDALSGTFEKDAIWKLVVEFFLLFAAGAWYFFRYIVPLRRILVAIKEVGTGKFGILPVDAVRNDEIGDLASEFMKMTDVLSVKDDSLQEQKRFTESLIESSAAAIFVLNPQHRVVLWNKACEELTGIAASSVVGTGNHWQAFYDHERPCLSDIVLDKGQEKEGFYEVYEKSTLVPDGLHAEGWYHSLNGRVRYITFDAAPVHDERGVLLAAIETLNDITERKRAEANMRLQSAALQAAANAIVITDRNGKVEWANPAFTTLTGYSVDEAVGRSPRELVKSDVHGQEFYEKLWDTILRGEVWRGQMVNRRKDGTLYPEGQTITPVKDANGEITHFIAIKRDLTEQRKLEEQLQQAQKMESIGTLAGGIAHDFNNILSAVIGYGQFTLLKMPVDDPLRHNIESILEAADRAARLTKELLMFSRKQSIDRKPVDLNLVVAKVEKFLKKIIGEDIAYNTVIHEEPIPVFADDHQLEQVLMNLATNARDAMAKGGTLTVTTEKILLDREFVSANSYPAPGPYALMTVSDTGEGMDEATRQRIFEPFFTTKDVGKGTGLGLAVTYGIIKQHEGFINVYSEPGGGTTFRIYLPLIHTDVGAEALAMQEETPPRGTETILLAEDDEDVRGLTKSLLTEFGYKVIEAVDGEDAVGKFKENSETIDLIMSDLIMPKMNGKEAVDEIRKLRPGVRVIFSSGYAPDTIQEKVSLTGGHLIAKPVSPRELLRKIRNVLDGN